MAILDKMIEQQKNKPDSYKVYYNILDGDQNGRDPTCNNFDSTKKSCLHRIAESDNKVTMNLFYSSWILDNACITTLGSDIS